MRELNDRSVQTYAGAKTDELQLVCECGDVACFELVHMTLAEYQALVGSGHPVLAAGHRTRISEP
jgi:hypothetical protein